MKDVFHLAIAFAKRMGGIASSAATTAISAVNPAAGVAWSAINRFADSGESGRAERTIRPRDATPPPIERTDESTDTAYARQPRGQSARPPRSRGPTAKVRASRSVAAPQRVRAFVGPGPAAASSSAAPAQGKFVDDGFESPVGFGKPKPRRKAKTREVLNIPPPILEHFDVKNDPHFIRAHRPTAPK